jgi:dihydrofolate synthase / folylpolyglutamate synthase
VTAPARFVDYAATTDYLFALKSAGVKFGIDRMVRLSAAIAHPERRYPVIHVAGTNGKGSVSAMFERILRGAGYRTGLYTSPHLVRLGERVQVDRCILSDEEIIAYTNELLSYAAQIGAADPDEHPSFFEFMTAMAFLQFARREVDAAVVEVGLGGRLDATNVVQPALTVITSIGFDHMEQLGNTIPQIASEKAGIIKPHRPLVIGRVPPDAERVIRQIAEGKSAPVYSVREAFGDDVASYPETNLEGDYQRWNAATALLGTRLLRTQFPQLTEDDARVALLDVTWPGRWQRIQLGSRTVILDASHNPEGAQVLDRNLTQLVAHTGRAPVIVTGVLGEFRARAMLDVVCRHAREVHMVPPHQARACSYEELETLARPEDRAKLRRATLETVFPTRHACAVGAPDDVVVVTGSIYLLGEVLTRLDVNGVAGEGALQDF